MKKKLTIIRWTIYIILLLVTGSYLLSFYIRIPPAGKGIGSNCPPMLKGVDFTADNTEKNRKLAEDQNHQPLKNQKLPSDNE